MTPSSTRKRIAICLSGLVRTYRQTYENFREAVLAPNQGHDIDIFISTWPIEHSNISMERTRRIAWNGPDCPPFPENPIDYHDLQAKYHPVAFQIDAPIKFNADWYTPMPGVNIQSLLSMTYKIYACDLLRRQHEYMMGFTYDVVMRARFDCLFPIPLIIDDAFDLSVITSPSMMQAKPFPDRDWLNDKFAAGNRDIMTIYSNWYLNFVPMILRGIPLQPETLLAHHLNEAGVKYAPWGAEMEMVRFM